MTNQLQQRGCRSCGGDDVHARYCKLNPSQGFHPPVLPTERTAEPEGEVPPTIYLPSDTDADTWNILAKNPSRDWRTREPITLIQYRRDKTCAWVYDDIDDKWDSACGESWQLTTGGPKENRMNYCHGCGGKLEAGSDG